MVFCTKRVLRVAGLWSRLAVPVHNIPYPLPRGRRCLAVIWGTVFLTHGSDLARTTVCNHSNMVGVTSTTTTTATASSYFLGPVYHSRLAIMSCGGELWTWGRHGTLVESCATVWTSTRHLCQGRSQPFHTCRRHQQGSHSRYASKEMASLFSTAACPPQQCGVEWKLPMTPRTDSGCGESSDQALNLALAEKELSPPITDEAIEHVLIWYIHIHPHPSVYLLNYVIPGPHRNKSPSQEKRRRKGEAHARRLVPLLVGIIQHIAGYNVMPRYRVSPSFIQNGCTQW